MQRKGWDSIDKRVACGRDTDCQAGFAMWHNAIARRHVETHWFMDGQKPWV